MNRKPMKESFPKKDSEREKEAWIWLKTKTLQARGWLFVSVFAGLGSSVLFVVQSFLLAAFLAELALEDGSPDFFLLKALLPVLILRAFLGSAMDLAGARASLALRQNIRKELVEKIVALGPLRVRIADDGVLSTMVLETVDAMDDYFSRYFPQKILAFLTPLLIVFAVAPYSFPVACLLFLTAPLVPFFMSLVGREAAGAGRRQFAALSLLSGRIREILRGLHVLRQLNATDAARLHLQASAGNYRRRTLSVQRLAFLSSAVLELFASVSIALVAVYLGMGLLKMVPWARGETPVALFPALFILFLIPEFYGALRRLGADFHARATAVAAVISLEPLLRTEKKSSHGGKKWKQEGAPEILFRNLSWQPENREAILKHINIRVESGERIGLVGPSGAGKSSILNLLLGFALPSSGEIRMDGKNLADFDPDSFRKHVSFLGQNPDWFSLSIGENLRLGKKDAQDEELYTALRAAGLEDFVRALPMGLETLIGEGGRGLSGGQFHRLALARAILQDAPLWVLDEPGAHLDTETAREVRQRIGEVSRNKTLVMAGHKLEGMEWLDRIVHIRNGRVLEEGPENP